METVAKTCNHCGYPILVYFDENSSLVPVYIDGNSGNYELTYECPGCNCLNEILS